MPIETKNGKILISQTNMNRLYHGSKTVWQVLREEGAQILVANKETGVPERLADGQQPVTEVVGIDLIDQGERWLSSWDGKKFVETIPTQGEKKRIKECRVPGLPVLAVKHKR